MVEHFAGRALTQITVSKADTVTFKIVGAPYMTPHVFSIGA